MTRRNSSRLAGLAFLLYIAVGVPALILTNRAVDARGIDGKLARIAQREGDVRLANVFILLSGFCALTLGVTLYAITREQDHDLATLGMSFRIGEGIVGALSTQAWQGLLWLATVKGADAPDARTAHALAGYLLYGSGSAATFFAMGSLVFCWLLLRGRIIPVPLAWLGLIASILWVITMPLQILGIAQTTFLRIITWTPMAAFEIPFALWLLFKGAAPPARIRTPAPA